MPFNYRTSDGDTADLIAWRFYGRQDGRVVEQLLEANPGLAEHGPVLPAGLRIQLPKADEPEKKRGVRLWD